MTRRAPMRAARTILTMGVGVAALVWVSHNVSLDRLGQAASGLAPLLPLLFTMGAVRVVLNVVATSQLFERLGNRVPFGRLLKAELVGTSIGNVLPAGRLVAEATKASMLAKDAPIAVTAAVATHRQALHLLASGIATACALFVAQRAEPKLRLGLLVTAAVVTAAGVAVLLARRLRPPKFLGQRLPSLSSFHAHVERSGWVPIGPLAALVGTRSVEVVAFAAMCHGSVRVGLVAVGIYVLGTSVADFVPGQVGGPEAAFTLFAACLGLAPTAALAVALAYRALDLFWTLGGLCVALAGTGAGVVRRRIPAAWAVASGPPLPRA